MTSLIPAAITSYTTQTKVCTEPDHMHTDPHVDILMFTHGGHEVVVESERWSLIYNIHVDDRLVLQEANANAANEYISKLVGGK